MKAKRIPMEPLELAAIDVRVRYACGCFVFQQVVYKNGPPVTPVWGISCSRHRQTSEGVEDAAKKVIQSLLKEPNP
jgi:hypothetical protein